MVDQTGMMNWFVFPTMSIMCSILTHITWYLGIKISQYTVKILVMESLHPLITIINNLLDMILECLEWFKGQHKK